MKRMLLAAGIAMGLHALLLAVNLGAIGQAPSRSSVSSPVTLSLTYTLPATPKPPPAPVGKVDEKRKKPKPVSRRNPPPRPAPEPEKKEAVGPAPEPPRPDAPAEPEPTPPVPETPPASVSRDIETVTPEPDTLGRRTASITDPGKTAVLKEAFPLYRENPPPRYPRLARRRGYQGVVVLDVLVDGKGRVLDLRVATSSGHRSLDRAALASVKDWSFEPGRRGNEPVEMWVRVPIRFQLK